MKRVFLASVVLMVLTGAAAAADLPPASAPYYKAPMYAPPYYNWTGFYLGVNGGGGFGRSSWDSTGGFDLTGALRAAPSATITSTAVPSSAPKATLIGAA